MKSAQFLEIYTKADYSLLLSPESSEETHLIFKIGENNHQIDELLAKHHRTTACFITACNPNGQQVNETANQERMKNLENIIQGKQLPYYFGQGSDPEGAWIENSLLVIGLEHDDADQLARHFEQNAIVWLQKGSAPTLRWYI